MPISVLFFDILSSCLTHLVRLYLIVFKDFSSQKNHSKTETGVKYAKIRIYRRMAKSRVKLLTLVPIIIVIGVVRIVSVFFPSFLIILDA